MKDFTLKKYYKLLKSLIDNCYALTTVADFIKSPKEKVFILRHDVDDLPENALQTAQIQNKLGVKGTYYFRMVKQSYNPVIVDEIATLGHEIGYHYEDLTLCKGDINEAIKNFEKNLAQLRKHYPVETICMHGSPLSKYDNRDIWKVFDYKKYGIIAEPYFDIDFNQVFYLTDTGRAWNNAAASIRDKVTSGFNCSYGSTDDIIYAVQNNLFPYKVLQNIHPQRWTNNPILWYKEWITQSLKNIVKKAIIKK
ncbi:MAG: hypothetical protein Kow0079_12080 [Vicingaceae bacterium]